MTCEDEWTNSIQSYTTFMYQNVPRFALHSRTSCYVTGTEIEWFAATDRSLWLICNNMSGVCSMFGTCWTHKDFWFICELWELYFCGEPLSLRQPFIPENPDSNCCWRMVHGNFTSRKKKIPLIHDPTFLLKQKWEFSRIFLFFSFPIQSERTNQHTFPLTPKSIHIATGANFLIFFLKSIKK